jgi:hypothetical protein
VSRLGALDSRSVAFSDGLFSFGRPAPASLAGLDLTLSHPQLRPPLVDALPDHGPLVVAQVAPARLVLLAPQLRVLTQKQVNGVLRFRGGGLNGLVEASLKRHRAGHVGRDLGVPVDDGPEGSDHYCV